MRRIVVPSIGIAFTLWAGMVVSGVFAPGPAPALASLDPALLSVRPERFASADGVKARVTARKPIAASLGAIDLESQRALARKAIASALATAPSRKSGRRWSDIFGTPDSGFVADASRARRFDKVIREASLSPDRLAEAFEEAGVIVAETNGAVVIDLPDPSNERFGSPTRRSNAVPGVALAYADPSPMAGSDALDALSAAVPDDGDLLSPSDGSDDNASLGPDFEETPDSTPLPDGRPRLDRGKDSGAKPARGAELPAKPDAQADTLPGVDLPTGKPAADKPAAQPKIASVKPNSRDDDPSGGGLAQGFRNLFGGGSAGKAGNGVAVYDISARKVYMPDGSVLEAHSGIGKMADNPRYVNVQMNGPTPPHTYNLKMREKRFHGVEALRMLPVDGKNKYGRDGFLTHSYLLRGGREESHGCVAFADYKRFLSAFKQGKVKQLVVVAGGGKAIASRGGGTTKTKPVVTVAQNGRGA